MMKITEVDKKILRIIQKNATLSQTELAEMANMSRSSFWRHVKDMEDAGIIILQAPAIDERKIGLKLRASCVITLNNHSHDVREEFESHILQMPNVLECYATSGGKDYMLTVVAKDMDDYYELMSSSILDHPTIESAHTSFVMKKIKSTTLLPI
ncbi:Lrp/AsnC family transcriptional regulator [Pseudemcibacter aquimaris]|uniref:Lrp/AsnC family transcriptional regulator n=1 Tax=Pseudemcibacter aquimaris TaxID=2857064 RepID=UPI0020128E96|nr:Lrp/AsnC family transcriptional regulator [Pseudemcibacter aquimaris]MCC3859801.1 Lrp/AsnC family transcriptional regulator [Pseudemcibacter aquimaris]WDU60195.1 Lrp/AsnC family transcriptional regulator [Pseudemcibacter aquimaris]